MVMGMDMAMATVPEFHVNSCRRQFERLPKGPMREWGLAASYSAMLFAASANSQTVPPIVPPLTTTEPSASQDRPPSFRIIPTLNIGERYTDNAASVGASLAKSDWVTDAAAGLSMDYRAARASANIDFQVDRLIHSSLSSLNNTQRRLNSNATLEAVEKWLFLDARANISQQSRSAFGSADVTEVASSRSNRIETNTYQFAPYVRGTIGNLASYQLRLNASETRTGETAFPDSRTSELTGFIKSAPSADRFGWSIDGNSLILDNDVAGKRRDTRIRASITAKLDAQMQVSVSGGTETTDLDSLQKRTRNTFGFGAEWSPSQRTKMTAVTQKRFFGNDHLVSITHRTPLTAWALSGAKEIAISSNELTGSNPSSVNSLLLDLLASTIPDPVGRADATQGRFEQTGIPATSGFQGGFLTFSPFVSRRLEASVVLRGTRNTATIAIGQREQRALNVISTSPTGASAVEEFRQSRYNATWAYRLSTTSNLRMVLSQFRTEGLYTGNQNTTQRLQSLFFVTQLGPLTSASLGVQRIVFDSTVASNYRENMFVSSMSIRF